jgi:hypothetical protein
MIIGRGKEFFIILMGINMKEISKMIILTEKENIHMRMGMFMKEIL